MSASPGRASHAIISTAANRRIYGNWSASIPSRFLDELPPDQIQREGSASMARGRVAEMPSVFTGPSGLMARKPRVIEAGAWEAPVRPPPADPFKVGERVFHKKFGYGVRHRGGRQPRRRGLREIRPEAGDGQLPGAPLMSAAQPGAWPMPLSRRRTEPLEVLWIDGLPEDALPAFEAAFQTVCATVGYFKDDPTETWRIEGVREAGARDDELTGALAIAALVTGIEPPVLQAGPIEAEGWLARTIAVFPETPIGRRFLVRPTHVADPPSYGRVVVRARCRHGLRQRRACLDPGLPDGLRGRWPTAVRGASSTSAWARRSWPWRRRNG